MEYLRTFESFSDELIEDCSTVAKLSDGRLNNKSFEVITQSDFNRIKSKLFDKISNTFGVTVSDPYGWAPNDANTSGTGLGKGSVANPTEDGFNPSESTVVRSSLIFCEQNIGDISVSKYMDDWWLVGLDSHLLFGYSKTDIGTLRLFWCDTLEGVEMIFDWWTKNGYFNSVEEMKSKKRQIQSGFSIVRESRSQGDFYVEVSGTEFWDSIRPNQFWGPEQESEEGSYDLWDDFRQNEIEKISNTIRHHPHLYMDQGPNIIVDGLNNRRGDRMTPEGRISIEDLHKIGSRLDRILIFKLKDDWYYVYTSPTRFFKCDQIEGLLKLLEDSL